MKTRCTAFSSPVNLGDVRTKKEARKILETVLEFIPRFWLDKRAVLGEDDLLLTLNADEMTTPGRGVDHALTAFRRVDVLATNGVVNMPFSDGRPGVYRIPQRILEIVKESPTGGDIACVSFWLYVVDLLDAFGGRGDGCLFPIHMAHPPLSALGEPDANFPRIIIQKEPS